MLGFVRLAVVRLAHVPPESVGSFRTPVVVAYAGLSSSYLEGGEEGEEREKRGGR